MKLDIDIDIPIQAGQVEEWTLLRGRSIRFEENGQGVSAQVKMAFRRGFGTEWLVRVDFLDKQGKTIASQQSKQSGGSLVSGQPVIAERTVELLPFDSTDFQNAEHFRAALITGEIRDRIQPDDTDIVQGRVLTPEGEPLPDAIVTMVEHNPGASGISIPSTITNKDGYYKLKAEP